MCGRDRTQKERRERRGKKKKGKGAAILMTHKSCAVNSIKRDQNGKKLVKNQNNEGTMGARVEWGEGGRDEEKMMTWMERRVESANTNFAGIAVE